MSINIKNREAQALIEEIKGATGKGTSAIVLELLRKEAMRQQRWRELEQRRRRIKTLGERYSARLNAHPASPEEIVGYDESGLPT